MCKEKHLNLRCPDDSTLSVVNLPIYVNLIRLTPVHAHSFTFFFLNRNRWWKRGDGVTNAQLHRKVWNSFWADLPGAITEVCVWKVRILCVEIIDKPFWTVRFKAFAALNVWVKRRKMPNVSCELLVHGNHSFERLMSPVECNVQSSNASYSRSGLFELVAKRRFDMNVLLFALSKLDKLICCESVSRLTLPEYNIKVNRYLSTVHRGRP